MVDFSGSLIIPSRSAYIYANDIIIITNIGGLKGYYGQKIIERDLNTLEILWEDDIRVPIT